MIDFSNYSHIIWDWNGTLLDDAWLCVDVMNGILKERNLPLKTLEEYRNLFDFPVRDYYIKLGFDFANESFEKVGMDFMIRYNHRQKESKLHDDVPMVLKIFSENGFHHSILSAREKNELIFETQYYQIKDCFDHICGLDDHYANGKTDVGIKLMPELGIDPGKIIFIGDTSHDVEVASAIGIASVLIPNGHQSFERCCRMNVPIVKSLKDLTSLI